MAGRNRFFARTGVPLMEKAAASSTTGTCVFISHKYEDLAVATKVGNQLRELEVDIWLDAEDPATQLAMRLGDQVKLAEAIERGLSNCTHLLALISPRTKGSWWIPYEIGSGRGRSKELVFFVHKDVSDLPSYLTFGRNILDQSDFYKWATEVSSRRTLTEAGVRFQKSAGKSALADVLPTTRVR